jgi:acetyl esterase/lipase
VRRGDGSVDGVEIHRDIVHTRVEGYRPLALDLYLPDSGSQAVCVFTHGGGWRVGTRRSGPGPLSPTSADWLARLAGRGIAVASVDYRLSGEACFPAQSHDVAAAIRWLREHSTYSLGALSFVAFGVSAGGLLASLAALDTELDLRACAIWYAVSDIGTMREDQAAVGGPLDPPGASREELLIGGVASDLPDVARAASPVHQVRAGAPPFLILHGADDVLVPTHQSERLSDALSAAEVPHELVVVPGYGHMFSGMPDDEMAAHVDRTAQFLLDQTR